MGLHSSGGSRYTFGVGFSVIRVCLLGGKHQDCVCVFFECLMRNSPHRLPQWLSSKRIHPQCRKRGFDTWVGKISWRRAWQPIPVFLPREFHGKRSPNPMTVGFPDNSVGKESACNEIPGREDSLKKEMATHSSILAWRIPWTEELGGLQSMESQRVGHN